MNIIKKQTKWASEERSRQRNSKELKRYAI